MVCKCTIAAEVYTDAPRMRLFSQRPWRNCWAAAAEGEFSLMVACGTGAGSDAASTGVFARGVS